MVIIVTDAVDRKTAWPVVLKGRLPRWGSAWLIHEKVDLVGAEQFETRLVVTRNEVNGVRAWITLVTFSAEAKYVVLTQIVQRLRVELWVRR